MIGHHNHRQFFNQETTIFHKEIDELQKIIHGDRKNPQKQNVISLAMQFKNTRLSRKQSTMTKSILKICQCKNTN